MAVLEVKTSWKTYENCFLMVGKYQADNSTAIEIAGTGTMGKSPRITVCIPGSNLAEDETVLDTNNCPWAVDFIKKYGLGEETGRTVRSGYCEYPVVKLNVEKIKEYVEEA